MAKSKWTPEQRRTAAIVMARGRRAGASPKLIESAIETILVEANARNPKHGDRDSLGAFQQRATWGTAKSRLNVTESADRYFAEGMKLGKMKGSSGRLAQKIQRSAFPDRYEQRDADAESLMRAAGGTPMGPGRAMMSRSRVSAMATPGVPKLDVQSAVVDALLSGNKNIMASLRHNLTSGQYMTEPVQPSGSNAAQGEAGAGGVSGKTSAGKTGGRLNVRELFHDPEGAYDEGQKIPAIGGHSSHVHVSLNTSAEAIRAGKIAQRMGLHVSEQSRFDKVDPVHTKGSFHYSDKAVDVSGSPAKMRAYFRKIKALGRLK